MKFLLILLTIISTFSFADSSLSVPSELGNENIVKELSKPIIDGDCLLAATREPGTCDWGECVDNCDAERVDCLKRSNSSVCGPKYVKCKKNRCSKCK